jgi:hypothetical protein
MVITVFGDTVLKPGKERAEAKLVEQLDPIVRAMPRFISNDAYVGEDGEEIGIIRFDSPKSMRAYTWGGRPSLDLVGHPVLPRDATPLWWSGPSRSRSRAALRASARRGMGNPPPPPHSGCRA